MAFSQPPETSCQNAAFLVSAKLGFGHIPKLGALQSWSISNVTFHGPLIMFQVPSPLTAGPRPMGRVLQRMRALQQWLN